MVRPTAHRDAEALPALRRGLRLIRQPEPSQADPTPPTADGAATWPPYLPHREIDQLMERLDTKDLGVAELDRLLELISGEIKRIRSTVVRLSDQRLTAARVEAEHIRSQAGHRPANVPAESGR